MSSLKKHIQVAHPEVYEEDIKTQLKDLSECREILPEGAELPLNPDELIDEDAAFASGTFKGL